MALPNGQILATPAANDAAVEPSMEDILASIRRIIASDQGVGAARQLAAPRAAAEPAGRPRPVGREQKAAPPEAAKPEQIQHPGEIPPLNDLDSLVFPPAAIVDETIAGDEEGRVRPEHRTHLHDSLFPPAAEPGEEIYDLEPDHLVEAGQAESLISASAGASISLSFQTLADSMLLRDPELFERIARETLRPMLKTWLDENLPSMVERLVRAEIERVARGGRSRD